MPRTQEEAVMDYMRTHVGITQLEATQNLGVLRLGARIHDLREKGNVIETNTITINPNRYGTKSRVAQYRLIKECKHETES